jgi:hypothetical protein
MPNNIINKVFGRIPEPDKALQDAIANANNDFGKSAVEAVRYYSTAMVTTSMMYSTGGFVSRAFPPRQYAAKYGPGFDADLDVMEPEQLNEMLQRQMKLVEELQKRVGKPTEPEDVIIQTGRKFRTE